VKADHEEGGYRMSVNRTHPAPAVLGHGIRADPKSFLGVEGWWTDSATNLRREAFDSCKLFVYICLLGASAPDPGPR